RLDRIVDEDELLADQRRLPRRYLCARPVGDYAISIDAPAQALVCELGMELGQIDGQQIVRRRIKRIPIAFAANAAAVEQRLVITGCDTALLAIRGARLVCGKMLLEESAYHRRIVWIDRLRRSTRFAPERRRLRDE